MESNVNEPLTSIDTESLTPKEKPSENAISNPVELTITEEPVESSTLPMGHRGDEFVFGILIAALGFLITNFVSVFKQDIPAIKIEMPQPIFARDPSIDRKLGTETVSNGLLLVLMCAIPIAVHLSIAVVSNYSDKVRKITKDTRNFLLGLLLSGSYCFLFTASLKKATGRFRPCFYDLCGWNYSVVWDGTTNLCSSKDEEKARMSFPSGHASSSFCAFFFLTLYLLGRFRLLPAAAPVPASPTHYSFGGMNRLLFMLLAFLPTFFATGIAISRVTDNYHHPSDILAGAIIGVMAASAGYFWNYGSIVRSETAGIPLEILAAADHASRHCNNLI